MTEKEHDFTMKTSELIEELQQWKDSESDWYDTMCKSNPNSYEAGHSIGYMDCIKQIIEFLNREKELMEHYKVD